MGGIMAFFFGLRDIFMGGVEEREVHRETAEALVSGPGGAEALEEEAISLGEEATFESEALFLEAENARIYADQFLFQQRERSRDIREAGARAADISRVRAAAGGVKSGFGSALAIQKASIFNAREDAQSLLDQATVQFGVLMGEAEQIRLTGEEIFERLTGDAAAATAAAKWAREQAEIEEGLGEKTTFEKMVIGN